MKNSLLICIVQFLIFQCFSQNPNISDQINLGGNGNEIIQKVKKSPIDNGYFVFSISTSNVSGDKSENSRGSYDLWILKLDENFNLEWDKTIGGSSFEVLEDVIMLENMFYISMSSFSDASGEKTMNSFGLTDVWVLCLDLNGEIEWQAQYGGTNDDYAGNLIEFSENSLLLTSTSSSEISGNKDVESIGNGDIWLLEINKTDGQIIQQRIFGTSDFEQNPFIIKVPNEDSFILWSQTDGGISGDKTEESYGWKDIWILKLNSNLEVTSQKSFGGDAEETVLHDGILLDDNFIYLVSSTLSGSSGNMTAINNGGIDVWLLKLDLDFNLIWDKSFGGDGADAGPRLYRNENGRLVVSASSNSNSSTGNKTANYFGGYDMWLLVLDEEGNVINQETYGGTGDDLGFVLPNPTNSSELLLACGSNSPVSGNKTVGTWGGNDVWLSKLDGSDFLNYVKLSAMESTALIYPNPFSEIVNFEFYGLNEEFMISFYSLDGKLIDLVKLSQGTIFYQWGGSFSEKFILYEIIGESVNQKGMLLRQ